MHGPGHDEDYFAQCDNLLSVMISVLTNPKKCEKTTSDEWKDKLKKLMEQAENFAFKRLAAAPGIEVRRRNASNSEWNHPGTRASGFTLAGERLPEGAAKAGILRAITSAKAFLPLAVILRIVHLIRRGSRAGPANPAFCARAGRWGRTCGRR